MTTLNVTDSSSIYKTTQDLSDMSTKIDNFKFTNKDIGKYLVLKWRYEEHGWSIDTLSINSHALNKYVDYFYGVYKIKYHNDWCEKSKDVTYKIHLEPIGKFKMWCPDHHWYTQDIESHISSISNSYDRRPVFDTVTEAIEYAIDKNFKLYPDKRSWFRKIFDNICEFFKTKN